MAEHLLEEQELSRVVAAHNHLVVCERLAQCVSGHPVTKAKVFGDTLQDGVNGSPVDGFVLVASVVGFATEHEVTEPNVGGVFQVERNCFDDGGIHRYVAVALVGSCVLGLLLQNSEPVTEGALIVDEVGEPQGDKVTDTQSKVDAHDKQHIVSVPLLSNEELGDADDVVHILDGLSSVLVGKLLGYLFGSGGDEASLELAAALLYGTEVDDT